MNHAAVLQNPAPAPSELARLDARFPVRKVPVRGNACVAVRACGSGPAIVCLHGIGSGSASWLDLALLLEGTARVIAWDAPGYGESTPVASAKPRAVDYADRLHALVDALGLDSFVLVGHSLGALTAACAARPGSSLASRIRRLVLISPAVGYGAPSRIDESVRVRTQRLDTLARFGIAGMAAQAADRLLSGGASDAARQWVRWNTARLDVAGYTQAVELLCGGDLLADLPPAMPVRVACGALDVVTTPRACTAVADRCGVPLEPIADAGHASYLEQPQAVAALLRDVLAA